MEELFEQMPDTPKSGMGADLFGYAVEEVDWYEIAEHWLGKDWS